MQKVKWPAKTITRFWFYLKIYMKKITHFCFLKVGLLLAFMGLEMGFSNESHPRIMLGIDVLESQNFDILQGKRVGLLTNQAGVNSKGKSTIEILSQAPNVNLIALYAPEHGINGKAPANELVNNQIDTKTGLPVFSVYGNTRRPTKEMLDSIDVLVIDIQDVGVRCYTYVSCMQYAVEACFEYNKAIVVLDRPNPLGGIKVEGPPMDTRWLSYVGSYRVPFIHGMTIGELALLAKESCGYLKEKGKLTVIPMKGWNRNMLWEDTGLCWVQTSPNIPTLEAVRGYPLTALGCEHSLFRHGLGTNHPFRLITYPGKTAQEIKEALKARNIQGIDFDILTYQDARDNNLPKEGVFVKITDWNSLQLMELPFHMQQLGCEWNTENPYAKLDGDKALTFNKHVGSTEWWLELSSKGKDVDVKKFLGHWSEESQKFKEWRQKYLLYR